MKILAIEQEIAAPATAADYAPYLEEEARRVWELQQEGILREIYFSNEREAILILECQDAAEAKSILNSLPLVKHQLIDFRLFELKAYDGFERLFKKSGTS